MLQGTVSCAPVIAMRAASSRSMLATPRIARRSFATAGGDHLSRILPTKRPTTPLNHSYRPLDFVDFRSDTATHPDPPMLASMISSSMGDDVLGEDGDTKLLERTVADFLGKDAACFVVSGSMANQLAVAAHLVPWGRLPTTVVVDARSHIWKWEAGGVSFLSGATVIPVLPSEPSEPSRWSHLDASDVSQALIRDESDTHVAPTRLVCVENTLDGTGLHNFTSSTILPRTASHPYPHLPVHLDGARLWNAKIKRLLGDYGATVDSASLCFSKGLGAPIGSVLTGSEEFIGRVRRLRKVIGGGWRQSGPLASACLHSLKSSLPGLHYDHFAASSLAAQLSTLGSSSSTSSLVRLAAPTQTNMVWADLGRLLASANESSGRAVSGTTGTAEERGKLTADDWARHMWERRRVRVGTGYGDKGEVVRLVVHKQNREAVGEVVEGLKEWAEMVVG
ncbi:hypothetical protein M427DRAFT_116521 [Gonapodya prolifera JEL478]|uniref:Aromatic amino acid beta-eliminating lyase/threonine aldolase domain-containing protein n=1 Tax=Gonapodya prolifera (strain JEL478) TaxID=1344416 RepID=A0A139A0P1_GONPJ|nr:hypothetical protein M427DRAFT_116521 [Gonapodya prolifera JEL478]|eukprot:KXS10105.1 hypothetical protein M427DRAFT_116521 [Gonapodya prolifera JEL478]